MADEASEPKVLLARAAAGDSLAWGALLTTYQQRLVRMVAFRIDPRLSGRLDPADIVQEAFVEAAEHRDDYFRKSFASLYDSPKFPDYAQKSLQHHVVLRRDSCDHVFL